MAERKFTRCGGVNPGVYDSWRSARHRPKVSGAHDIVVPLSRTGGTGSDRRLKRTSRAPLRRRPQTDALSNGQTDLRSASPSMRRAVAIRATWNTAACCCLRANKLFRRSDAPGDNNIGEFLAIVHLSLCSSRKASVAARLFRQP